MDFIRRQRCEPGYNPLKHAFYGPVRIPPPPYIQRAGTESSVNQDADLILLALATHEPCFRILREDPREKFDMRCILCQGYDHFYKKCMGQYLDELSVT
jgi:5'-3' exonuclease